MVIDAPDCGRLFRGEKVDRTVDERTWDAARRIRDMDQHRVLKQVISPVPVMFAYDCPLEEALPLLWATNDGIGAVVAERPDRFDGFGGIPLQDVDAACAETQRCVRHLGLAGIEIGTGSGVMDLDNPAFDPLWRVCEELDALIFIHPDERAPGFERLRFARLIPSAGYPAETGIAAVKLLMSGVLVRHPRLRFLLAHAGGTLPWMLPRLDRVWSRFPDVHALLDVAPSTLAKRFAYDTLTFDEDNLQLLIKRIGADRLVVGTDYPFALGEDPPAETVLRSAIPERVREAILSENAARFLQRAK
jgi:aminocarboxymuconate-semialdehyde decarboxylase